MNLFPIFLIVTNCKIAFYKSLGLNPWAQPKATPNAQIVVIGLDGEDRQWQGLDFERAFIDAKTTEETAEWRRLELVLRRCEFFKIPVFEHKFEKSDFIALIENNQTFIAAPANSPKLFNYMKAGEV